MDEAIRPLSATDGDTDRYAEELRERLQSGRYDVRRLGDAQPEWYLVRCSTDDQG